MHVLFKIKIKLNNFAFQFHKQLQFFFLVATVKMVMGHDLTVDQIYTYIFS